MVRAAVLLLLLALPASAAAAPADRAAPAQAWTGAPERLPRSATVRPGRFKAYTLHRRVLRDRLGARRPLVSIPGPDGTLQRFRATSAPVLSRALARRHPNILTFSAAGVDDPTATARFDLTPLGFHASVRSEGGAWYVDPAGTGARHVAYFRADLEPGEREFEEGEIAGTVARAAAARAPGDPVVRRTFRLALANDPSYATAVGGTGNVAAAKTVLLNRINQIYGEDLAVRLTLVADLNWTASQYGARYSSAECIGDVIDQNHVAIDNAIGSGAYDIGHLVTGTGGGGIAGLGVVGNNSRKGEGCTSAISPSGDAFHVDYVAHEMGHQFGGPHTFNGVTTNCGGGNRNNATAVEPGSGSSIMAYAGICGADNIQNNSDPYFSQRSITNIRAYLATVPSVGTSVTTGNRSPVVNAGPDATIPVQTPFVLEGSATDADGDPLVFTWEQNNTGAGTLVTSNTKASGPLFRMFSFRGVAPAMNAPTAADRVRTFPDLAQVAADNTNAETGACANVDCHSEFLPETPRLLSFRLTARDRFAGAGGVSSDDAVVTVAGTTPFAVTAPTGGSLTGNNNVTVTWNVAGTTAAPFNHANVRISYSTDGGLTFPEEVLASTPNDGSQVVNVPNVTTSQGRFRVQPVGGVYFDVSDGDLDVTAAAGTPSPTPTPSATPTSTPTPTPTPVYTIPTPTPTAVYAIPTATDVPGPGTGAGVLAPDLSLVPRRVAVKARGRIFLRIQCKQVTAGTAPTTCAGRLTLKGRGKARPFAFGLRQVGRIRVQLTPRTRRVLRTRNVRARLRATVGTRSATKRIVLKRRR